MVMAMAMVVPMGIQMSVGLGVGSLRGFEHLDRCTIFSFFSSRFLSCTVFVNSGSGCVFPAVENRSNK